jgi:hypothetical protein
MNPSFICSCASAKRPKLAKNIKCVEAITALLHKHLIHTLGNIALGTLKIVAANMGCNPLERVSY